MAVSEAEDKETLQIGEYTVHLRHLGLPMGLVLDDVKISGRAIQIVRHPLGIDASEDGNLRVHVSDASLAKFLDRKAPAGMKHFQVSAEGGKLLIRAVKRVLVDLKVSAVCSLEVVRGQLINVRLESVDVAGADIRNLIQSQLNAVNPVIDLGEFPFPARIDHAELDHGGVTLVGRIMPKA